jgi:hypothetical protein
MAKNSRCATAGVGRKRVSSSRSPAMVSTRKASHQGTAAVSAPAANQAALPISQHKAPMARTTVKGATSRYSTWMLAATSIAAATTVSPCVTTSGAPASRAMPPRPAAAGAR